MNMILFMKHQVLETLQPTSISHPLQNVAVRMMKSIQASTPPGIWWVAQICPVPFSTFHMFDLNQPMT